MPKIAELRLFEVCLEEEKKLVMLKALDNRLDFLERSKASRIAMEDARHLIEEIQKMKTC